MDKLEGAGGTQGGTGLFFGGLGLFCVGMYWLLTAITVSNSFSWGAGLFGLMMGGYAVPSGILIIPFAIGVGMVFYNGNNKTGWFLIIMSIVAIILGVLMNIRFVIRPMVLFEFLAVFVMIAGGAGMFIKSLQAPKTKEPSKDPQRSEMASK